MLWRAGTGKWTTTHAPCYDHEGHGNAGDHWEGVLRGGRKKEVAAVDCDEHAGSESAASQAASGCDCSIGGRREASGRRTCGRRP